MDNIDNIDSTEYTLIDPITCPECGKNMYHKDTSGNSIIRKYWTCECGNYVITDIMNHIIYTKNDEDLLCSIIDSVKQAKV